MKDAFLLFLVLAGTACAAVLCGEDTGLSGDNLRFYDFVVEGPENPVAGDEITVEFTIRNVGKETVALGSKGVFAAAEHGGERERFGYTAEDEWLGELESVSFRETLTLDEAGEWSVWPSYQLKDGTYGPDYWAECSFDVEEEEGVPDLRITDVWYYGDVPGVYTEIRYFIRNVGDGAAGPSTTAIYIDGRKVAEDEVDGVRPGEQRTESVEYSGECSGTSDRFRAVADADEEVGESNEGNNGYEREYLCPEIAKPDLMVEIVSSYGGEPCSIFDYSQGGVVFTVKNAGNGSSPAASVRIYIDGNWSGSVAVPALQPGQEFQASYGPAGTCSGREDRVRIAVDVEGRVSESSEGNNEAELLIACENAPGMPADLLIKNVTLVNGTGERKVVNYTIRNNGQGHACKAEAGLFLDGVLVAGSYAGTIPPARSISGGFAVEYESGACSGISDILEVVADHAGKINESNETNNGYSIEVRCPAYPDLYPSRAGYLPGKVFYTIKNNGSAASPQAKVKIRVSGAGVDMELEDEAPPVEPGEYEYGEITGVSLGRPKYAVNYTISIDVDYENEVMESDEANNFMRIVETVEALCRDGSKDGNEEDIDCGGPDCTPCDVCNATTLPASFDWRWWKGRNWVSPVQDQGSCGSCWAFSTMGAMEAKWCIENDCSRVMHDFSEQALLSCSAAGTCFGGARDRALNFTKINGTVEELCFPYSSGRCLSIDANGNKVCNAACNCTTGITGCKGVCGCQKCSGWDTWKIREYFEIYPGSIEEAKRILACHGPVSVASAAWEHAFLLVGWDDANQSWIIKNSWSGGWGDNGFGKIPYEGHAYSDFLNHRFMYVEGVYSEHE